MASLTKKIPGVKYPEGLSKTNPWELADNLDSVAPADTPIMSTCVIVEKMEVAVSDGRNGWYLCTGNGVKSIKAGDLWANLF